MKDGRRLKRPHLTRVRLGVLCESVGVIGVLCRPLQMPIHQLVVFVLIVFSGCAMSVSRQFVLIG